jgi:Co/Zn/Cd efflux system component
MKASQADQIRRAVRLVAALNLAYFGVELAVALRIGSVSLLADGADFFEDAAVNFLIFAALGWSAVARSRVGMLLSAVLLLPATAFLWTLWSKFAHPTPPDALPLSLTGLGALAINLFCAFTLARHRAHAGSLTRAAFLSARNDAIANVAIIAAGGVTAVIHSLWPDVIVGLGIAAMNLDAAREIWSAARHEHTGAQAPRP